jgi:ABC-type Fe3+-siderophore transport system permease subunit
MHRGVRTVLDIGVVGLAFATAIVTSLTAFYFGEPWGTTEDYLTVILIGTAAQTVLKAVTDSLEQRAADRDDTEAEPEPAA